MEKGSLKYLKDEVGTTVDNVDSHTRASLCKEPQKGHYRMSPYAGVRTIATKSKTLSKTFQAQRETALQPHTEPRQ